MSHELDEQLNPIVYRDAPPPLGSGIEQKTPDTKVVEPVKEEPIVRLNGTER